MAVGRPIKLTPNVARKIVSIQATADQTTFTPTGGYRIGELAVYRNGVRLANGRDYTAVDGANVILEQGASVDDTLEFGIFDSFNVADAIGANGNQSMGGDLTVGLTTLYSGTTGIVSTGEYYGDGSNLTGVAGAAVTEYVDTINLTASGIVSFTNTTDSTSSTSGAVIISGGVGIAKSLFVGNNVTIGGTVTYEDVTNVDSVGIITAQTGVIITAGRGLQVTAGGLNVAAGVGTFKGILNADAEVTAAGGVDVTGGLKVGGASTLAAVSASGEVTAAGGVDITGGLKVGSATTFSGDVTFTGDAANVTWDKSTDDLKFADGAKAIFGTGGDLKLSHDGTNSYIESDTGDLIIGAGNGTAIKLQPEGGEDGLTVTHNAAVDLYYNNSKKFETTTDGINVTGSAGINTSSPRAKLDVRGTVTLGGGQLAEKFATSGTALNSATSIDLDDGMVHYRSANLGAANVKPDIISSVGINTALKIGEAISVTIITAVNSTSNYVSSVAIDGRTTGITTNWVGGDTPSDGGGSNVDIYAFNILKTADNTFLVIANQTKCSS